MNDIAVKEEPMPEIKVETEPMPGIIVDTEPMPEIKVETELMAEIKVEREPMPRIKVETEPICVPGPSPKIVKKEPIEDIPLKSVGTDENICSDKHPSGKSEKKKKPKKTHCRKTLRCGECNFRTACKYQLRKHTKLVHTGENPFQCDLCDFSTVSKYYLRNHKKKACRRQRKNLAIKTHRMKTLSTRVRSMSDIHW